jgi:hypothetical protein
MEKIWAIIRFVIFLFLGHGIMLALADQGFHPDRFIANLIDRAIPPNMSYSVNLIFICVFALVMTVIWESLHLSQRISNINFRGAHLGAKTSAPEARLAPPTANNHFRIKRYQAIVVFFCDRLCGFS